LTRKVERLIDNKWCDIEFKDLKTGDIFKLYDDGKPVTDYNGRTIFVAYNDAFKAGDIYKILYTTGLVKLMEYHNV
jgi:hypothetical protein